MKYQVSNSGPFPIVKVQLKQGEDIRIENGSMVYHNGKVRLDGKMNSGGEGGFGGALKALGRSMVSGESFFITNAVGLSDGAEIALAPGSVGQIMELNVGDKQYRLNDKAFLASDNSVGYSMISQGLGKAVFGGTGGVTDLPFFRSQSAAKRSRRPMETAFSRLFKDFPTVQVDWHWTSWGQTLPQIAGKRLLSRRIARASS